MPSHVALKMADDLVRFGELLGFEASKEHPITEGSLHKIDAFWKLPMPAGSIIPSFNIASIEIQYSNSPASISHNILKSEGNIHPSLHIVLSYKTLTTDFIENVLRRNYPAGLLILNGEKEVNEFNLWINKYLLLDDINKGVIARSTIFNEGIVQELLGMSESDYEENVLHKVVGYLTPMLVPKEVTNFVEKLLFLQKDEFNRGIFDSVFYEFLEFIQDKMRLYDIQKITIPSHYLLTDYQLPNLFIQNNLTLNDSIDIEQNNVSIRDSGGRSNNLQMDDGNVSVFSEIEICTQSLTYDQFYDFITYSCEHVLEEFEKYRLDPDDVKLLRQVLAEFG